MLKVRPYNLFIIRSNKILNAQSYRLEMLWRLRVVVPLHVTCPILTHYGTPSTCCFGSIGDHNNLEMMFEEFYTYLKISAMWSVILN